MNRYGVIPPDRIDIRGCACLSVDLRAETGGRVDADATRLVQLPHAFTLSVFGDVGDGEQPVGEILCIVEGVEVAIVGHLTGRPGVREVTPDHLSACLNDPEYRRKIAVWAGIAA
jgi:hypothetical protein